MTDLLDVRAVARLLSIHKSTVWRLVRQGKLPPPIKLGVQLRRWDRSAVEAALSAGQ